MIKGKIVKIFGGHKQFDLKLREALTAAVEGYTSHVELVAACRALGAGRIAASASNLDARKAFIRALSRAGKRLVPTDPIDLKCTHLDLSGMGFAHEHVNGLAQLLRCDVHGSLTELNLDGFAIPVSIAQNEIGAKGASALAAILKETQIQELKCAAAFERSLSCQCPLTRLLSHTPSSLRPSLAVFVATASELRAHPRLQPSSRRR